MENFKLNKCENVQMVLAEHMNGFGRLFGGKLMEWIDITAAVCARRYSRSEVTTVKVSELVFEAPAYLNDTLILKAEVVREGTTSMTVRVDTFVEHLTTGVQTKINTAHLVMVAIDKEGRPKKIKSN